MRRTVLVLDRDGVINVESTRDYVRSVSEFEPIAGAIDAIARLVRAGFPVYIATNQSGIGQKLYTEADLDEIHAKLRELVRDAGGEIKAILYCPHTRDAGCDCRKPKPGMLLEIACLAGVDPTDLVLVGDAASDHGAAIAAGCAFALVRSGKGNDTRLLLQDVACFADLAELADCLVANPDQSAKWQ